jgi:thiamine biosynthesis protein ThiI
MFILRYHEIALKGGNRSFFESKVKRHVEAAFSDMPHLKIRNCRDHFKVTGEKPEDREQVRLKLKRVFGIVNFSEAQSVELNDGGLNEANYEAIKKKSVEMINEYIDRKGLEGEITFRVSCTRRDKSLELKSFELAKEISVHVLPEFEHFKVKMHKPKLNLFVDWGKEEALIFVNKESAAGGLPTGSAGKVVSLISAGFDSPVASYMMMKRGATVAFVHFHSYPAVGEESIENVKQIVRVLNRYQLKAKLYLVPLVEYQKFVVAHAPAPLRVLLYRRMMFRIAQRVMAKEKGKALVTGESLAQVASQTLKNIHAVDIVAERPVFRPLIGMDKQDIITMAEQIGTAEISMQPYEDCCSLYVPKAPALAAAPEQMDDAEKTLDVERFEKEIWEATKSEWIEEIA